MRKTALVVALLLASVALPLAGAQTTCTPVPQTTGVCVSAGTDDGTYAEACRFTTCAGGSAMGDRTLAWSDNVRGSDELSADADGTSLLVDIEQHDRLDVTSREDVSVLYLDAEGRNAYLKAGIVSDHPWIEADVTDQHTIVTSHMCFMTNTDGTIIGIACGDWVNGEIQPVVENHLMETVDEIRNDPLVRCVLSRACLL